MITKPLFGLSVPLKKLLFLRQLNIIHNLPQLTIFSVEINEVHDFLKVKRLYHKESITKTEMKHSNPENCNMQLSGFDVYNTVITLSKIYSKVKRESNMDKKAFVHIISNILNQHGHKLQTYEMIHILQMLVDVEISNLETFILSIMKLLKNDLVNLTIADYKELNAINSKLQSNYLRNMMNKDLKDKLDLKISMDLDRNNLEFLVNTFIDCRHDIKKQKIAIQSLENFDFEKTSVYNILKLINAFTYITEFPKVLRKILNKVQHYLILNIKNIETPNIISMLQNIRYGMKQNNNKNNFFYNEILFNHCAEELILRNVHVLTALDCISIFLDTKHIHKNLFFFIVSKYVTDEKKYSDKTRLKIATSILFTSAQYNCKFEHEEHIFKFLEENVLNFNYKKIIKYAFCFALRDHFNFKLLEKVFDSKEYLIPRNFPVFLCLWQKVKLLENYKGTIPSELFIKQFDNEIKKNFGILLPYLESGLGGSQYVKINLKSKLFHKIDYVTIFREGGYPIAFVKPENNDIEYIEDLKLPPNCQIVVIIEIPKFWYFRNLDQLLGQFTMYVQNLEALSITVVPLNFMEFSSQPANLKLPYLMKAIKSKLNCNNNYGL